MAVRIIYRGNHKTDDLDGLSVFQAREEYSRIFNIPLDAVSIVNGDQVGEGYILKDGDELEFSRKFPMH